MKRISRVLERMLDRLTPVPANLTLKIDVERLERELMDPSTRRRELDESRDLALGT